MRVLRWIRSYPEAVLAVAVAALAVWVVADWSSPGNSPRAGGPARVLPDRDGGVASATLFEPPPARPMAAADGPGHEQPAPVPVSVLPKLKAGMTRSQVEELLGLPAPDQVQPVTLGDGRLTYRTAYELAELDLPPTVRPIQPRPRVPAPPRDPSSVVALEFDASRPGHPLVQVLYPDPLF